MLVGYTVIEVPGVAGAAGNARVAGIVCVPRLVWFGVRGCEGDDFADAFRVKPRRATRLSFDDRGR